MLPSLSFFATQGNRVTLNAEDRRPSLLFLFSREYRSSGATLYFMHRVFFVLLRFFPLLGRVLRSFFFFFLLLFAFFLQGCRHDGIALILLLRESPSN